MQQIDIYGRMNDQRKINNLSEFMWKREDVNPTDKENISTW